MFFFYHSWGANEIISRVFQALAVINSSNGLQYTLIVAALLGFIFLMSAAAFNLKAESIIQPIRLLVVIVFITGIMMYPSTVYVLDNFHNQDIVWKPIPGQANNFHVDRVPAGIALPAVFASSIGNKLTRIIETSMNNVDAPDKLSSAGLWLSARTLKQMLTDEKISDPTLISDFKYFLENCTYFDIVSRRVSLHDLKNSRLMAALSNSRGGLTSVHKNEHSSDVVAVNCNAAWNGDDGITGLRYRIQNEGVVKKFKTCQHLRGISMAMTNARRTSESAIGQNPHSGQARTCGNSVFSHALHLFGFHNNVTDQFTELVAINLMKKSSYLLSQQDPMAIEFATYIGSRQRNATYVVAGELAAVALPALRGLLEAIIILLLPILIILGLLFFERMGGYLKNGMILVLWVHLWPPVMVIINNIGQWLQRAAINKHVIIHQGNFTLSSVDNILSDLDVQMALARYMLVLVPMIAWALVRSGEMGGAFIASRLLAPGEGAASAVSSNVATNNWSMDKVDLEPRTTVGPHIGTTGDAYGGRVTQHEYLDTMILPANQPGYISAANSRSITEAISRSAESARTEAQEQKTQFSNSVETAYESAYGKQGVEALQTLRANGVSDQVAFRALQGTQETVTQAIAKTRDINQSESTAYDSGFGTSGGVDLARFFGMPLTFNGTMNLSQSHGATLSEALKQSYNNLSNESKSAMQEVSESLESTQHYATTASSEKLTSETHRAHMSNAASELESYSESQQYAERLSLASQQAQTTGQSVIHEITKDPENTSLLREFHDLYHAQGMSFDDAWKTAQEKSGISLDIDTITNKLLGSEISPTPTPVQDPFAMQKAHAENKSRVDSKFTDTKYPDTTVTDAQEIIFDQKDKMQNHEFKQDSSEHFQEEQRIDRKVKDEDGNEFVVPKEGELFDRMQNRQQFLTGEFFNLTSDQNNKDDEEKEK